MNGTKSSNRGHEKMEQRRVSTRRQDSSGHMLRVRCHEANFIIVIWVPYFLLSGITLMAIWASPWSIIDLGQHNKLNKEIKWVNSIWSQVLQIGKNFLCFNNCLV